MVVCAVQERNSNATLSENGDYLEDLQRQCREKELGKRETKTDRVRERGEIEIMNLI